VERELAPCSACGVELEPESCWHCAGAGGHHDCGEDSCCCLHPDDEESDDWWSCDTCLGSGELWGCPYAESHGK
jgi:hypothetical protein